MGTRRLAEMFSCAQMADALSLVQATTSPFFTLRVHSGGAGRGGDRDGGRNRW